MKQINLSESQMEFQQDCTLCHICCTRLPTNPRNFSLGDIIVMEFVEGQTLKHHIQGESLEGDETLDLGVASTEPQKSPLTERKTFLAS